jgi:hypothetical protein
VVSADARRRRRAYADTYLAVLRPWFAFLNERGFHWNARPEAVHEYTLQFLTEARCALQRGRIDGRCWGGFYDPETGYIFVKPGSVDDIAANVIHESIRAVQAAVGDNVISFRAEFAAFSAERI